jgi:hypothetical protein
MRHVTGAVRCDRIAVYSIHQYPSPRYAIQRGYGGFG